MTDLWLAFGVGFGAGVFASVLWLLRQIIEYHEDWD